MAGRGALRAALALFIVLCAILLASRCRAAEPAPAQRLGVRVLRVLPHDPRAYTQGLLWHEGHFYESTGQRGASRLRRVDPETGTVLQERRLGDEYFGEGLARIDDRLYQLSWESRRGWVWDLETFEPVGELSYATEGWGLCFDGSRLWMSDGTDRLVSRDPATFQPLEELRVTFEGERLTHLNELECAEGWIYANVFTTDTIVRIDPVSGRVAALIDASQLREQVRGSRAEVLNGIAYDAATERFYLTGKYWPSLFEVVFE